MKAIVVGGGIAGLVVGRALALQGIGVTLLEQKAEIGDEGGIGIGIQSNAMKAFAEVGVAARVVAAGAPVEALNSYDLQGRLVMSVPPVKNGGPEWPGFTGISRTSLHDILVSAAREAGVELRTRAAVARVEDDGSRATAFLADGSRLSADFLIGADGIASQLRAAMFPQHAAPFALGEGIWRGLVPGVQRHDVSFISGSGSGSIGYTPLRGDLYLFLINDVEKGPPRGCTDLVERMTASLEPFSAFIQDILPRLSRKPGDVVWRPLEATMLPSPWYRGRILLIGDAAHAGPPTLAQGAAMGIEDSVVLARSLAETDNVEDAFALFMSRRYDRVRTIMDASLDISRAMMRPEGVAIMRAAQRRAAEELARPF